MVPKSPSCGEEISRANTWDAAEHIPEFHRCSFKSLKGFFPPISTAITINRYGVQARRLHITINLKGSLSGHQESQNSARGSNQKCLLNKISRGWLILHSSHTPDLTGSLCTKYSGTPSNVPRLTNSGLPLLLQNYFFFTDFYSVNFTDFLLRSK